MLWNKNGSRSVLIVWHFLSWCGTIYFRIFGYKSIKSIEEKANKDAERAAKQTSEDVTKSYLDEKLDGKVSIAAEKSSIQLGLIQ